MAATEVKVPDIGDFKEIPVIELLVKPGDSRKNLRQFFEVNRFYVTLAALKALADDGEVPAAKVAEAIKKYGLDTERPAPWTV